MIESGFITAAQAKDVTVRELPPEKKPVGGDSARYYADWIVDEMQDLIGPPDEDIVVETAMNPAIQKAATDALVSAIATNGEARKITQGAAIAIRPNGEVVAMVGGYDYASSQFNRATQARRQPGSSFKPFVYLAALQAGANPQDVVFDGPIEEGRYRPKNFGGEYYGDVTLETALALSLNSVTFRLIKALGPQPVIDVARRLGITSPLAPELSLGLGTATLAPLEMATAYASLANGGMAIRPYGILKITSAKGELYYQRPPQRPDMLAASPASISDLTGMMRGVIEFGTGQNAKLPVPAYGKTGTSQESRDAWFIGFTPEMAAAVWMGNDDDSPMKAVTGGSFPALVWKQIMLAALGKYPSIHYAGASYESSGSFEDLISRMAEPEPGAAPPPGGYERPPRILRPGKYND